MAPLTFRFADADDLPVAAHMIAHSFPGPTRLPMTHEAQLRAPLWGGGAETLFVGETGGRMVAALQAHPLRQWIGGRELACTGIGTVAIAPTHRRRGLGAALMRAALRASRERGDVLSALYPFRTSFYQRLGYGVAGSVEQYQIEPGLLRDAPERENVALLTTDAERAEALTLYHHWIRDQNGQLTRPPRVWDSITTGTDRALVGWRDADGALRGYAVVEYRLEPVRYLDVDELVWTTPAARRGLYGWIASMGDQWSQVIVRALPSHRLADWIEEPRLLRGSAPGWRLWAPAATVLLGTMARILDIEGAFAARTITGDFDVTLHITDSVLEENVGAWRITGQSGAAHAGRSATSQPDLRLDISTLARLYVGALAPTAALHSGLLECSRPELLPALDRALALPEPWTFDRF